MTRPEGVEEAIWATPCHRQNGCIRAFEDDTCGDEGQCSIVLAIQQARADAFEEVGDIADDVLARHDPGENGFLDSEARSRSLEFARDAAKALGIISAIRSKARKGE